MINNTARFKHVRGFTLIELVVVFSILAILSTLGIAAFVSYSRSQTLNQATNDFVTILNTAKSKALSQDKPSACASSTLNGYRVTVDTANETYTLNVVCSGVTIPISTVLELPAGVTFNSSTGTPPTTTTSVFFSILTSGVVGSGNIVLAAYGQTHTVTITSVGGIQ